MAKNDPIKITLFNKHRGVLSKKITADENGRPVSDGSACIMGSGKAKVITIDDLTGLAETIGSMKSSTALALGVPKEHNGGTIDIVTAANEPDSPGSISRSLRNMHFAEGVPAPMLLDVDFKGAPREIMTAVERDGIWHILCEVMPFLKKIGHVVRASTSSGLRNTETEEEFDGSGGLHIYVTIMNGADAPRALDVMAKRLWLAEVGWIMVSKAGSQLKRTLVDVTVASPERLVFEGAPIVEPPLVQDVAARKPLVFEGQPLNTEIFLEDLTPAEEAAYQRLVAQAKKDTSAEAKVVRDKFEKKMVKRLVETKGMPETAAKKQIARRHDCFLGPDVELEMDDGSVVTVETILNNFDHYIGCTMADPLEGVDYGRCKAKIMPDPDPEGFYCIHTFGHGGAIYRMMPSIEQVKAAIRSSEKRYALTIFAEQVYLSKASESELTELKDCLHETHNIGPQQAARAIRNDLARRRAERLRNDQEELEAARINDDRMAMHIPPYEEELTKHFVKLDAVLSTVDADAPPMRNQRGQMATVVRRSIPKVFELRTDAEINAGMQETEASILAITPLAGAAASVETEKFIRWHEDREIDDGEGGSVTVEISRHVKPQWISAYASWEQSACPKVSSVSKLPIVLQNGELIAPSGLERNMQVFFDIDVSIKDHLPKGRTSVEKARAAFDWLCNELLADVLTDIEGKAIAISLMLSLIEGPLLPEKPGFIVTAAKRGGGKTTLLIMLCLAVLGERPPTSPWDKNAEERKKTIMASLFGGITHIVFDNLDLGAQIDDTTVNAILTSGVASDRVLGKSEIEQVLALITFMWTGNNLGAKGDLASRVLRIWLEVTQVNPEERPFKHPDPFEWVLDNRPKILSALYDILLVERPKDGVVGTRFKKWMHLVGRPVEIASGGQIDFTQVTKDYENSSSNEKAEAQEIFFDAVITAFKGAAAGKPGAMTEFFTATDLITKIIGLAYAQEPPVPFGGAYNQGGHSTALGKWRADRARGAALRDAVEMWAGGKRFSDFKEPVATAVGKKLKNMLETVEFDGKAVRLQSEPDNITKGTKYWVQEVGL